MATMQSVKTNSDKSTTVEWWRGAVIYQIYPRSFLDTDNDGIGDLCGITRELEYVGDLGVDAIWLSPFFTSPMKDFGYDVSNYCEVDPIFGDMADFDALVEKAHKLDLKVIVDQVYSHTSDQHEWFEESRSSRNNEKADWYVWADPKADGSPPNNWMSVFGGGSWTWDSRRAQYYFHNFLTSQPDLNVHNEAVQNALLGVAKFWLDRGVDGFRLDAINFAMHDPQLRDNPVADLKSKTPARPFDMQKQIYNQSHSDIPVFLKRLRALYDQYGEIFSVAEIGGPDVLDEMHTFTAGNDLLSSAYSFDFLYQDRVTADLVTKAMDGWRGAVNEGWPSWAFSNHDAPRVVSRWETNDPMQAARLYQLLLVSLRGNIFIYQGEELGLPQAHVPFEDLQDPEAIANWPTTLGRDGARTPIPWEKESTFASFSHTKPWLPIDPSHYQYAVSEQVSSDQSILSYCKSLLKLRNDRKALRIGALSVLDLHSGLLGFVRTHENEAVLCLFNLTDTAIAFDDSVGKNAPIITAVGLGEKEKTVPSLIPAYSGLLATLA